ncbi:uncharacterized protein LOC121053602 [Oryza brachyantha]|uniref:uncharacterized protein LOC121053602 n=1 Tax=Oryza brachyantha TaxID=4533 RepID=UPI001ADC6372|nr:uncharacterized protein LOC121053602 [Oryza brachyantha]
MDKAAMRSQLSGGEYQYYYQGAGGAGGLVVDQEIGGGVTVAAPSEAAAVDGVVLLMEMLDDDEEEEMVEEGYYSPAPAGTIVADADRLSHVIRSLEAEIGGAAAASPAARIDVVRDESTAASCDDAGAAAMRRLEHMLSDDLDDGYGAGGPFGYGWPPEVAAVHEAAGWCVYGDEHLYYGDGPADEQVYSPLWQQ